MNSFTIITFALLISIFPKCLRANIRSEIVGHWVFYNDSVESSSFGEYYEFYDQNSECAVFGFKPNSYFPAYPRRGRFHYNVISGEMVKVLRESKVYVYLHYLRIEGSHYLVEVNADGSILEGGRIYKKNPQITFRGTSEQREKHRDTLDFFMHNPDEEVTTRLATSTEEPGGSE